jgi:hypothetical protein
MGGHDVRYSLFGGLGLILCLAGCGTGSSESAPPADDTIVLQCSGQSINQNKREPASYLIKVHPGNQFQQSLHFYSDEEKRFVSPCEDKGFTCYIAVGNDFITEVGEISSNGEVNLRKLTEINRHTGAMRVAMESSLPLMTVFEGQCTKGEMPPEQATKF